MKKFRKFLDLIIEKYKISEEIDIVCLKDRLIKLKNLTIISIKIENDKYINGKKC